MGVKSEVETTVAESAVPSKKLRLKILARKPVNETCEISQAPVVNSLKMQPVTDGRSKALIAERKLESNQGTNRVTGCLGKSSVTQNWMTPAAGNTKFDYITGSKRRSEEVLDGHERKRLKMDHLATLNCQTILAKIMKNENCRPFCMPVDPDAWGGIDDYFDIIKNPMDLGTIQKKLQKKTYTHVEEFESDVRLTFSNAMLYNPPDNWVHKNAKELNMMFIRLWKFNKMRMDGEHKDIMHQVEIKQRGLDSHNKITNDAKAKPEKMKMKAKPEKMKMDGEHKAIKQQDLKQRGPESSHDKITYDEKGKCSVRLSSQVGQLPQKGKCSVRLSSQVGQLPQKAMPQKERGSEALKLKVSVKEQRLTELNVVNDGKPKDPLSFKEHDFATFLSTTGSLGASAQGLETLNVEVSPSKALRVSRLKSRFADTILKAQHYTLLEPGSETNAANWQQEKLILERRQQEEKARIEAQIRAVESAARLKAESEIKQQREAAREASRLAVAKMKRSVDFEDNLHVLRDLEAIIGSSLVVVRHDSRYHPTVWSQIESEKLRSPLERLGLYIKEEYMLSDDDGDDYDVEEGEVVL